MRQKKFELLTDNQKVKAQKLINDALNRAKNTIEFYECEEDKARVERIIEDSIDIYYKHISNILVKPSFKDHFFAMYEYIKQ